MGATKDRGLLVKLDEGMFLRLDRETAARRKSKPTLARTVVIRDLLRFALDHFAEARGESVPRVEVADLEEKSEPEDEEIKQYKTQVGLEQKAHKAEEKVWAEAGKSCAKDMDEVLRRSLADSGSDSALEGEADSGSGEALPPEQGPPPEAPKVGAARIRMVGVRGK